MTEESIEEKNQEEVKEITKEKNIKQQNTQTEINKAQENKKDEIIKEEEREELNPKKPSEEKKESSDKESGSKKPMIIGVIILIIILAIILLSMTKTKNEKFEYEGFKFEKIKYGEVTFYETNITIAKKDGSNQFNYNVRLRNDPRILEDISTNLTLITKKIYLSFPQEMNACGGNSSMAVFELVQFLTAMGIQTEAALTTNTSNNTLPIKNCSSDSINTVIIMQPLSNQTRIYQANQRCLILEAKECKLVEVSERLILAILQEYKKTTPSSNLNNS